MPKRKIKTIENFTSYVKVHLTETFPDCIIDTKTVKKDNGYQTGIVICKKDTIFAPIIYLEPYFARLRAGTSLSDIFDEIVNDCKTELGESVNANLDDIKDFSLIKDKICYRLANKEMNSKLLSTIPHRNFYDMAVIYYINLSFTDEDEDEYLYTVKVTNNLAKHWSVDEAQLYELAQKNTPRLERGNVMPLINVGDIASRLHVQKDHNQLRFSYDGFDIIIMADKKRPQIYVATNAEKVNGAGVVLYKGLLAVMAEHIGSFFILPSSVHECILAPGELEDAEIMLNMVREVNTTVVSDEDVLSNSCLYYDAENHKLQLIE